MARQRNAFTDEQKELICTLWKQGMGARKMCREIPCLRNHSHQTIYPILKKAGLYKTKPAPRMRRHKLDDKFFDSIDTEHKAYWLGLMIADGFLTNSGHSQNSIGISLEVGDKYLLEEFAKDLNTDYEVKTYTGTTYFDDVPHEVEYARLFVRSKHMFDTLSSYGFTTDKSYHAKLPLDVVPENLIQHLIRGLHDGDGSLSKAGGVSHTYDFKLTGTLEVVSAVQHIFGKENVQLQERHPERQNNNYSLVLCGDAQVCRICDWMYDDATIYLQRKYDRYLEVKRKYA